jgi:predicted  nucleic acid-binding Zn-ribbon protein
MASLKEKMSSKMPFKKQQPVQPPGQGMNPIWTAGQPGFGGDIYSSDQSPSEYYSDPNLHRNIDPRNTTSVPGRLSQGPSSFGGAPYATKYDTNELDFNAAFGMSQGSVPSGMSQGGAPSGIPHGGVPSGIPQGGGPSGIAQGGVISQGQVRQQHGAVPVQQFHNVPDYPPTPNTTPTFVSPSPTPIPVRSEVPAAQTYETDLQRLLNQLQMEKSAHEMTKRKLDNFPEEKSFLLREITSLKSQIETLEKENTLIGQNLEIHNQSNSQKSNEMAKLQASLQQEKFSLVEEVEKERNGQLSLTIDNSQLKARVDTAQKLQTSLVNEVGILRTSSEKEKIARMQFETENTQYRENWAKMHQNVENEKTSKSALHREIQELQGQIKGFETLQTTHAELKARTEYLDIRINEEQSKRSDLENRFEALLNQFHELEGRRDNCENLREFSEKLSVTVPTFTESVETISNQLSGHGTLLKTQSPPKNLNALLEEFRGNTQQEIQKQNQLLEKVLKALQQRLPKTYE